MSKIQLAIKPTPNPQAMMFECNQPIAKESRSFSSVQEAFSSPLAMKIFGFPWAQEVFIGPNFVSITKQDWVDWDVLAEPLCDLLSEHLEQGLSVLEEMQTSQKIPTSQSSDSNDTPLIRAIKDALDREIRPQVALDGGDVVFADFKEQVLYIHMRGSCSGCPSSTYTLKQGIEVRLKELFPEIQSVEAI